MQHLFKAIMRSAQIDHGYMKDLCVGDSITIRPGAIYTIWIYAKFEERGSQAVSLTLRLAGKGCIHDELTRSVLASGYSIHHTDTIGKSMIKQYNSCHAIEFEYKGKDYIFPINIVIDDRPVEVAAEPVYPRVPAPLERAELAGENLASADESCDDVSLEHASHEPVEVAAESVESSGPCDT